MEPNPLIKYVHELEDRYARNGDVSFMLVPPIAMREFEKFRDDYLGKPQNEGKQHSGKIYRAERDRIFSELYMPEVTVKELTEIFNNNCILTDDGTFVYSENVIRNYLHSYGIEYKRIAPRRYL